MKKILLRIDGSFLIIAGLVAAITDFLSYWKGTGPWGELFYQNPHVIGVFEGHCFALLTGCLLWYFSRNKPFGIGNITGIAAHLICGLSNIYWFDVFETVNRQTQGFAVTVVHFIFVAVHLYILIKTSKYVGANNLS